MSIAVKQYPSKVSGLGIGILVIFCIGAALFSSQFYRQEDKRSLGGLLAKGNSLVSLLTLYPLMDYEIRNQDFFLRTVSEYSSQGDLAYLFVHDADGKIRMSLAPPDRLGRIPPEIQSRSLHTLGLTQQSFSADTPDRTIYEFSKPIFTAGERAGTVRIGLRHPRATLFSMSRISFMALLAFFIVATAALVYYSVSFAIRPLKKLNHSFKDAGMNTPPGV